MHATIGNRADYEREATFRASFPDPTPHEKPEDPAPAPSETARYDARQGPRWGVIGLIVALHVAALATLVQLDVIPLAKPKPVPTVVTLLAEPPPPAAVPQPQPQPKAPVTPPVTVPRAEVHTPNPPPSPIQVTTAPPPPAQAVIVAPPALKPVGPSGPVSVGDLMSKTISADPPRYPMDSRRKREQGTVSLMVTLGLDGRVSDIGIARSSGFDRLDKAALDAVRRWRWSPTTRGGAAVMVRGIVDIPFVIAV